MENKSIEEIANSQKNFLSTKEVAAVLGISPLTFRRRWEEYAEFFPIERVGKRTKAALLSPTTVRVALLPLSLPEYI